MCSSHASLPSFRKWIVALLYNEEACLDCKMGLIEMRSLPTYDTIFVRPYLRLDKGSEQI